MAKVLEIKIKKTSEVLKEFASVLEKARKGENVKPQHGLVFDNLDTIRNVLTKRRLELMSVIKSKKPQSIYELSKLLKRDRMSVKTDLEILKKTDILSFKRIKEGRTKNVPVVNYDSLNIEVEI